VGKVGTGFDDATLASVRERLGASERSGSPFSTDVPRAAISTGVTWVEPRLLAEVVYVDRTRAGMLRQARFHSLREDKSVDEPTIDDHTQGARANMHVSGVTLTNPDRVLYPDQGITKLRLAQYYADIGTEMLRWTKGRPLSLVRCPEGSEEQCFYQKHPGAGFAASLPRVPIEESDGVAEYVYLESERDLIALVQSGVLEVHAWNSTVADLEHPDMLVFDLDPSEGVEFEFTKATARALRDLLGRLDLGAYVRTTGGKGLHVVVPLVPKSDWDGIKAFARGLSETMAATDPDRLTTNMSKQKRFGKVFIDYLRNSRGATAIAN
jgi:bifunctional non-homologous end joining protein LigD